VGDRLDAAFGDDVDRSAQQGVAAATAAILGRRDSRDYE
jgi:hypothetical protein